MTDTEIAAVCHEANRMYCLTLGDTSQPTWFEAPTWQRESAEKGVRMIRENPATTPEQSHEGWMAQKVAEGWKYGPAKNPEKKEHPCMVPYIDLPIEQRVKDHLFGAIARTLI